MLGIELEPSCKHHAYSCTDPWPPRLLRSASVCNKYAKIQSALGNSFPNSERPPSLRRNTSYAVSCVFWRFVLSSLGGLGFSCPQKGLFWHLPAVGEEKRRKNILLESLSRWIDISSKCWIGQKTRRQENIAAGGKVLGSLSYLGKFLITCINI